MLGLDILLLVTFELITLFICLSLQHCTPVDPRPTTGSSPSIRTYEFAFRLDSNNGKQPPMNLGEIFVVHSPGWKQPTCLGMIGSNDINSTFLADQKIDDGDAMDLFKLWICVCGDEMIDTGWLPEHDMVRKFQSAEFTAWLLACNKFIKYNFPASNQSRPDIRMEASRPRLYMQ